MFKRIYIVLVTGTLVALSPLSATLNSATNIKKVIQKDGKVIVIIRENGKDREVVLDKKEIDKILNKNKKVSDSKSKKVVESKDKNKEAVKVIEKKKEIVKVSKKIKDLTKKKEETAKSNKKSKKIAKEQKKSKKTVKTAKKSIKKIKHKKTLAKKTKQMKSSKYKVKNGDTVFSIARKFKVSISDLQKLNKFSGGYLIHPGDSVKIPSNSYIEAAKKAVKNNKKTVYKVKVGDTLSEIAKSFNMTTSKLQLINNFKRNPLLKPGMEINVIGKASVIKSRFQRTRYQVKSGDTLWSISRKFNLTTSELRLLNPKIKRRGLARGAILKVSKREVLRLAKLRKTRKIRLSGLLSKYRKRGSGGSKNVVAYAKRFLGTRYVWGATSGRAFDCSGFTQYVMRHAKGRTIPRVSRRQAYYGRYISRRNLRAGDLIFFDTSHRRRGYVNHVGIYIGNGRFIHASSAKHRVVITSLNKPFYRQRFMWGRRVN